MRRVQGRRVAAIRMDADPSFLFWLGSHLEGQTQLQRFEWTRLWATIWQVFWCLCTNEEWVTATLDVLGLDSKQGSLAKPVGVMLAHTKVGQNRMEIRHA